MKEYTHQQWLDKLKSRFGENVMDWAAYGLFGTLSKGLVLVDDYSLAKMAAYGLFGTLSKGDIVITENGNRIEVFPMAEKKEKADQSQQQK